MNERVKQIALECYNPYSNFDHEKFAKLIVQECAEVLVKWKGEPFPFDEDLAASLIKEHFGVNK